MPQSLFDRVHVFINEHTFMYLLTYILDWIRRFYSTIRNFLGNPGGLKQLHPKTPFTNNHLHIDRRHRLVSHDPDCRHGYRSTLEQINRDRSLPASFDPGSGIFAPESVPIYLNREYRSKSRPTIPEAFIQSNKSRANGSRTVVTNKITITQYPSIDNRPVIG